jgi:general secretion pathway protein E
MAEFAELSQFTIDPDSVRMLGTKFADRNHVVVLGVVDRTSQEPCSVGMLDPDDKSLVGLVEQALGRRVRPVRLNEFEIKRALDVGFGRAVANVGEDARLQLRTGGGISFAPGRPVPAIVADLLAHACDAGASDIHIERYEDDLDVRLRIDGVLHQLSTPVSVANADEVTTRIKILAELDISETRIAQDGRIMATLHAAEGKRPLDFRVAIVPGPFGEDAVLRILDSKPLVGLTELGFTGETLERFQALIRNPEGIVFVTGPTGSGKTTTLYSALKEINSAANKVLTVEDPIEYHFAKVNQKQVGPKMSFADYARAFMRQDPDILLIGEVRDEETASIATRAAQTGHLVLSTLHTNGSVGTISRLGTLGVAAGIIADTMLGALAQRLVRRVCVKCKEEAPPDAFAKDLFGKLGARVTLVRGRGCEACRGTGFKGRVGLYELFLVDDATSDLIARGTPAFEVRRHARAGGMRSLFDDAMDKIKAGVTTLDEVRLRVPHRMMLEATEGVVGE